MLDAAASPAHGAPLRVSSGEVARFLGKTAQQLATTRDRVIRKGILHAPISGALEFSVPGFVDYVRRRTSPDVGP